MDCLLILAGLLFTLGATAWWWLPWAVDAHAKPRGRVFPPGLYVAAYALDAVEARAHADYALYRATSSLPGEHDYRTCDQLGDH
jgi:hypothetical protein